MSNNEKKDKGLAIAGTIVVHALVVLVLFLMAFKTNLPDSDAGGVEVNLGMMDQGMGETQPEKSAIPQVTQPQQQRLEKTEEENLTQDNEEAPAIEEKKVKKQEQRKKPVEQPKQEVVKKQEVNEKALYKKKDNSQAGGSEGETGQPGDQGDPNGDFKSLDHGKGGTGGGSGIGPGSGDGAVAKLGHRKTTYKPIPPTVDTELEIIKVDIKVNRKGIVVSQAIADGYRTTTTKANQTIALNLASRTTFEADEDAPELEKGTITYTFKY